MLIQSHTQSSLKNYTAWENVLTPDELDTVEAIGDGLNLQKAGVLYEDAGRLDPVRSSLTAWLDRGPQTQWLYERLERLVRAVNDQVYRYDLTGFSGPLQYTVYDSSQSGHFGWHADQGETQAPRKLSFSLQLTAPDAYEGCDLEIFNGSHHPVSAPRFRGLLIMFPSYAMHRVTPIRAGRRKALVGWLGGPPFR